VRVAPCPEAWPWSARALPRCRDRCVPCSGPLSSSTPQLRNGAVQVQTHRAREGWSSRKKFGRVELMAPAAEGVISPNEGGSTRGAARAHRQGPSGLRVGVGHRRGQRRGCDGAVRRRAHGWLPPARRRGVGRAAATVGRARSGAGDCERPARHAALRPAAAPPARCCFPRCRTRRSGGGAVSQGRATAGADLSRVGALPGRLGRPLLRAAAWCACRFPCRFVDPPHSRRRRAESPEDSVRRRF
jgi:hypothetical protein